MKINEFIEVMSKNTNKKLSTIIETKKYVSIDAKKMFVETVIDSCVKNDNGFLSYDSLDKYLMFTMGIISLYTNLEFGVDGDALNDYDLLCEANLLDAVIDTFAVEYERTNNILNMMLSDILRKNSIEALLASLLNAVVGNIDRLSDAMSEKIDSLNENLNSIDPSLATKFSTMISELSQ